MRATSTTRLSFLHPVAPTPFLQYDICQSRTVWAFATRRARLRPSTSVPGEIPGAEARAHSLWLVDGALRRTSSVFRLSYGFWSLGSLSFLLSVDRLRVASHLGDFWGGVGHGCVLLPDIRPFPLAMNSIGVVTSCQSFPSRLFGYKLRVDSAGGLFWSGSSAATLMKPMVNILQFVAYGWLYGESVPYSLTRSQATPSYVLAVDRWYGGCVSLWTSASWSSWATSWPRDSVEVLQLRRR